MEYTVRQGDTLWAIAERYLGSPFEWPRLWRYNNRGEVVARTGQGIPDPNLIYLGQKLMVPLIKDEYRGPIGQPLAKCKQPEKMDLTNIEKPFSFSYDLSDIKKIEFKGPGYRVTAKLSGKVTLTTKKKYPITAGLSNKGVELEVTNSANNALGTLISDTSVQFDANTKKISLKSSLVSRSDSSGLVPESYAGVEVSTGGQLKLVYTIKLPDLKGKVGDFYFNALDCSYIIELEPDTKSGAIGSPVRAFEGGKAEAVSLFVGAGVIVVATLVEDFLTAGVGVADDAASFALAAAMITRGISYWRAIAPKAKVAARVMKNSESAYAY